MSVRALGRWVLAAALVAVVAGCGVIDDAATRVANRDHIEAGGEEATPTTVGREIDDVEDRYNGEGIGDDDEVILAALQDVETYWDDEFTDTFDTDFEPVDSFYAYGPDTETPPCTSPPPDYDDIAANAFFCSGADIIAWDTDQLIPEMQDRFGDFTLGIVMAHEYGHAIQDRIGFDGPTIAFEQQADCFAGAWTQWVREGDAENFEIRLEDLDSSLAGFLELRDSPNTSLADPGAHGTAFDRVSAFQDGFFNGAEKVRRVQLSTPSRPSPSSSSVRTSSDPRPTPTTTWSRTSRSTTSTASGPPCSTSWASSGWPPSPGRSIRQAAICPSATVSSSTTTTSRARRSTARPTTTSLGTRPSSCRSSTRRSATSPWPRSSAPSTRRRR